MSDLRTVDPLDTFQITGRGPVFVVVQPDPPHEVGEHVLVKDAEYKITAIERQGIRGTDPGKHIGLLVRPIPAVEAEPKPKPPPAPLSSFRWRADRTTNTFVRVEVDPAVEVIQSQQEAAATALSWGYDESTDGPLPSTLEQAIQTVLTAHEQGLLTDEHRAIIARLLETNP